MTGKPTLVTFDCAQTIIDVTWTVHGFIRDCMAHLGIAISQEQANLYEGLYFERLPEFLEINMRRDPNEGARFWRRLGADWLDRLGLSQDLLDTLVATTDDLAYGENSVLFRAYEDAIPCFQRLQSRGIRLAVISNWDYSLHRVLRMFRFDKYLELAVASLEEGVEKPNPRLFHLTLDRLQVRPEETIHVGDNPEDDVEGAKAAGIRSVLIDRSGQLDAIRTLDDLEEAFAWTD